MTPFTTISKKYSDELSNIEFKLKKHYHFQSIASELELWSQFVSEIETGYVGLIYEYENDLSIRTLLDEVIEMASPSLKEDLLEIMNPLDEKFKAVTTPVKKAISTIRKNKLNSTDSFWFFRVPKNISDDLKPDLDEHGRK